MAGTNRCAWRMTFGSISYSMSSVVSMRRRSSIYADCRATTCIRRDFPKAMSGVWRTTLLQLLGEVASLYARCVERFRQNPKDKNNETFKGRLAAGHYPSAGSAVEPDEMA